MIASPKPCNCNCEEFITKPIRYDCYEIIDDKLAYIQTERVDERIRLFCRDCGKELENAEFLIS